MIDCDVGAGGRAGRNREGFTLLELIVVITIIGILGTVVLVNVVGRTSQAREMRVKADLQSIYRAAQGYNVDTGFWPESIEELIQPKHPVTGDPLPGGLEKRPKDPWGNDYEYELIDGTPVIRCLGRDNSPGGAEEDADHQYPEEDEGF